MGKFNRALVFSAPLIIYALGLWGSQERTNNPCILCDTGFFILKQRKLNIL